ncbi:MAG: hypothetical protein KF744_05050 [Taibaiella sp.]|nr:hypothetical protein [Taibaiella sp.]
MPLLLLFLFVGNGFAFGQDLTEQFIVSETPDSLIFDDDYYGFNADGTFWYLFFMENKGYIRASSGDTIGPIKNIEKKDDLVRFSYGENWEGDGTGSISIYDNWYCSSPQFRKVTGPYYGKVALSIYGPTRDILALTVQDSAATTCFLNGLKIATYSPADFVDDYRFALTWCSCSNDGSVLYCYKQKGKWFARLNDSIIYTSRHKIDYVKVVDSGMYTFKEVLLNKKRYYRAMWHLNDTQIEIKSRESFLYLNDEGGYRIQMTPDNTGSSINIINGMYNGPISDSSKVMVKNRHNFLFTMPGEGVMKLNVNGTVYSLDADEIFATPSFDNRGNFATHGRQGYYVYKYINGIRANEPLSKYGVRAEPVCIQADGTSIHYFRNDDSLYLFRDDELIWTSTLAWQYLRTECYIQEERFDPHWTAHHSDLFVASLVEREFVVIKGNFVPREFLTYYPDSLYFQNTLHGSYGMANGSVYLITRCGRNRFLLNIDNKFFKEVDGVDEVLKQNYFSRGKLVFYAIKGRSVYRYEYTYE